MSNVLRIVVFGLAGVVAACGGGGGGGGGGGSPVLAYFTDTQSLYRADLRSKRAELVTTGFDYATYVALSPDGEKAYVADEGADELKEVTLQTGQVRRLIYGYSNPTGIEVDADGIIYTLDGGAGVLLSYAPESDILLILTDELELPRAIALEPGEATALVAEQVGYNRNVRVRRVDLRTGTVSFVAELDTTKPPSGIAVSSDGAFAIVAAGSSGGILVRVNLDNGSSIAIPMTLPWLYDVEIEPGDRYALVGGYPSGESSSLSRVDLATGDVTLGAEADNALYTYGLVLAR